MDLGCGSGQLTLPMARHVHAVIGVDVEPDMLQHARQAARDADVRNVTWMLGADTDMPALRRLLGEGSVGAVTIGQALHWMNHQDLFQDVAPLLRPGGGIAVIGDASIAPDRLNRRPDHRDRSTSYVLVRARRHKIGTGLRRALATQRRPGFSDVLASARANGRIAWLHVSEVTCCGRRASCY